MKKIFFNNILIFLSCVIIDQISKMIFKGSETAIMNQGMIFNLYSDISSTYRVIVLCSFFGFIFFAYLIALYVFPPVLNKIKVGVSLLLGGIFGNVIDRTILGASIDFIPLSFDNKVFVFNCADVFQWIGAILIVFYMIKKEKIIWYPDNERGKYLVNPKEQMITSTKLALISLSCSLLLGIFCFTFLRNIFVGIEGVAGKQILLVFTISYISISLIFTILVFFSGIIISHKTAGPLYAFEKYVEDLLEGNLRTLKLREGDNYQHLTRVSYRLLQFFKKRGQD
mgnify:CR=1 FL=1